MSVVSMAIILAVTGMLFAMLMALIYYRKGRKDMPQSSKSDIWIIAQAIREGAYAFLKQEYVIITPTAILFVVLLSLLFHPFIGLALLLGTLMSSFGTIVGMRANTIYNGLVAEAAQAGIAAGDEEGIVSNRSGNVAIRGGSVMGFAVVGCALFGLLAIWLIFGIAQSYADPENLVEMSSILPFLPFKFVMFPHMLTAFTLGCSLNAIFNRVAGGIFTKIADMSADIIGKVMFGLDEDDYRNPLARCDAVGDNVGDGAGNASDMMESFTGILVMAVVLANAIFSRAMEAGIAFSEDLLNSMMYFPLAFAGMGVICCTIAILFALTLKSTKNFGSKLKIALFGPAIPISIGAALLCYFFFGNVDLVDVEFGGLFDVSFRFGWWTPFICALIGVFAGVAQGLLSEFYTSDDYKPTQELADLSQDGTAVMVVGGISLGKRSYAPYAAVFVAAIALSINIGGFYGLITAAIGMLSLITTAIAIDNYGPIADNAGGIVELSRLDKAVRAVTDGLDALGNVTAAVGKGLNISSGVICALVTLCTFAIDGGLSVLNMLDWRVLVGAIIGGATLQAFAGKLLKAVNDGNSQVIPLAAAQIKAGNNDSTECTKIIGRTARRLAGGPILILIAAPLLGGLIGGLYTMAGVMVGAILSASMNAIEASNSGSAWDNAKKRVEAKRGVFGKLTPEEYKAAKEAAVNCDTVGDPKKDVEAPNYDIGIKTMGFVSLIVSPLFMEFSFLNFIEENPVVGIVLAVIAAGAGIFAFHKILKWKKETANS